MLLSNTCTYGIRAAMLVSARTGTDKTEYLSIKQIARQLDVSFYFLTKVLQVLTHARIMESHKGPSGGVRLARPAKSIVLMDIVEAMNEEDVFESCIMGLPDCTDANPCPLHKKCDQAMTMLRKLFETTNLAKMAKETNLNQFRL